MKYGKVKPKTGINDSLNPRISIIKIESNTQIINMIDGKYIIEAKATKNPAFMRYASGFST